MEQETPIHTPEKSGLKVKEKKRGKKNVVLGHIHVLASFNNTIITVTDPIGNTITNSSPGAKGFKGSRKGTPFAAQVAAEDAARRAYEHGMRTVQVFISGPGSGRDSAVRAISGAGLKITWIEDVTPVPFNGCRPRKRRRV